MQARHGPMYVGMGVFRPLRRVQTAVQNSPTAVAHPFLFRLAPLISLVPAFAAWAVVPFDAQVVLSNANAGLLYLLAMTSLGVYGVILAGWASNSKYAFLGAMRGAAQVVSYEIATAFALVGALIAAASLNVSAIVMSRPPAAHRMVHVAAAAAVRGVFHPGVAKPTARRSSGEGESEIVAANVEYPVRSSHVFLAATPHDPGQFLTATFFVGACCRRSAAFIPRCRCSTVLCYGCGGCWPRCSSSPVLHLVPCLVPRLPL